MYIDRAENNSLVLAVVLVCILVFLALIIAVVAVIYFIFKKGKEGTRPVSDIELKTNDAYGTVGF